MNRVIEKVQKYTDCLNRGVRIDNGQPIPEADLAELQRTSDFNLQEVMSLQSLKSRALLAGLMSNEEAQYIYDLLGEGGTDRINSAHLAVRLVLTNLHLELLNLAKKGKI